MARITLDQLREKRPTIDRARMEATTEDDIRRHAAQDGETSDLDVPDGLLIVPPARLRRRLAMSQAEFSHAIRVPLKTVQNWEQRRTRPDPAARTLLALLAADPKQVLGLLGWIERPGTDAPEAIRRDAQRAAASKATGGWVRRDAAPGRLPDSASGTAKRRA